MIIFWFARVFNLCDPNEDRALNRQLMFKYKTVE